MKEYGCGQIMVKGEVCTSLGDVVNLCDVCQRKLIEAVESAQHHVQRTALQPRPKSEAAIKLFNKRQAALDRSRR